MIRVISEPWSEELTMFVDTLDIDFTAARPAPAAIADGGDTLRLEDILVDAPVAGGLPSALSFVASPPPMVLAELPAIDPAAGIVPV